MIRNRDLLKKQFRWESDYLYPVCANIFLTEGASPDSERLADCNRMIKESVGIFSNFRGNVRLPLICSLACDQDPQARWERAQGFYQIFKEHFFRSEFLALGAAMLAGSSKIDAETLASRARILYKRMKKEHPLLTGWEDSVSALLLAQSTRDDDMLIEDVEQCYQLLFRHQHMYWLCRKKHRNRSVQECWKSMTLYQAAARSMEDRTSFR